MRMNTPSPPDSPKSFGHGSVPIFASAPCLARHLAWKTTALSLIAVVAGPDILGNIRQISGSEIFREAQARFAQANSWTFETRSENQLVASRTLARRALDGLLESRLETAVLPTKSTHLASAGHIRIMLDLETGKWVLFPSLQIALKIPDVTEDPPALRAGKLSTKVYPYNLLTDLGHIEPECLIQEIDGKTYYEVRVKRPAGGGYDLVRRLASDARRRGKTLTLKEAEARVPTMFTYLIEENDLTLFEYREYNRNGQVIQKRTYHQMALNATYDAGQFSIPTGYSRFYPETEQEFTDLNARFEFLLQMQGKTKTSTPRKQDEDKKENTR
jgi:hypothetical protein